MQITITTNTTTEWVVYVGNVPVIVPSESAVPDLTAEQQEVTTIHIITNSNKVDTSRLLKFALRSYGQQLNTTTTIPASPLHTRIYQLVNIMFSRCDRASIGIPASDLAALLDIKNLMLLKRTLREMGKLTRSGRFQYPSMHQQNGVYPMVCRNTTFYEFDRQEVADFMKTIS